MNKFNLALAAALSLASVQAFAADNKSAPAEATKPAATAPMKPMKAEHTGHRMMHHAKKMETAKPTSSESQAPTTK